MGKFKVNSIQDNKNFLITDCYKKLCKMFKTLKVSKGRIVHVVGAPGTGKSANIYSALDKMDLNVYDVKLNLKDIDINSKEVFNRLFESVSDDLGVREEKIYEELSKYDAVLFADSFHDSHFLNKNNVGFSQWTDNAGFCAFYFYLLCMIEYLNNRREFKKMNIVLQTAWRIYINGKKYDIFTDLGILSRIIVNLLKILFDVVEISYSEKETITIVKMHVENVDENVIKPCIQKYGCKPRFICDALEK